MKYIKELDHYFMTDQLYLLTKTFSEIKFFKSVVIKK